MNKMRIGFICFIFMMCFVLTGCKEHVHEYIDGKCECGDVLEPETYTVTYKDIDGNIIEIQEYEGLKRINFIGYPEVEGYEFLGWYNQGVKCDIGYLVNENITLDAVYKAKEYTIYFDTNGGNIIEPIEVEYGHKIFIEEVPKKEGYTFNGWVNLVEFMPSENITLLATYTINKYKITFLVDEKLYLEYELEYGSNIPEVSVPSKEGYEFIGWDKEIPEKMPAGDLVLTGNFKEIPQIEPDEVTLYLESFGGVVDNKAGYNPDGSINLPTPEKDEYKFLYWAYDRFLTEKVESIKEYNNEILYACYEYDSSLLKDSTVVTLYNKHAVEYDEITMFDSSKSGYTSKYWYKIGIKKRSTDYYISGIAVSGTSISTLDFDYVILGYSAASNYKDFINMNIEVGDTVKFLIDPEDLNEDLSTNIVSFLSSSGIEDTTEVNKYLDNLYGSIEIVNQNIDLVTSFDQYQITWKTSNRETISATGEYHKPYVTRNVHLSAYIKETLVYDFEVIVEGEVKKSTALSTGYIYTPYSTITQNAMNQLDIIYCAFFDVNKNADWTNLSKMTNYVKTYIYDKAKIAGTKIVISVNQGESGAFGSIAADEVLRKKLADNILKVIKELNLDGVDIDWETPTSAQAVTFTLLMKDIYETVKAANPEYLVTAAIGGGKWQPPKYDLTNSIKYLDYVNLMTYSMATGNGYYQNSLYKSTKGRTLVSCSIDESIEIFNDLTVPNNKILVGIPFYTTVQTESGGPGSKTGNGKSVWYSYLYSTYKLSDTMKEYFDEECGVPYRYDEVNQIFISFDNERSIEVKCDYINTLGLAGIMYWQYGQDVDDMLSNAIGKYINK